VYNIAIIPALDLKIRAAKLKEGEFKAKLLQFSKI
jgi:hypothetical protein